MNSQFWNENLPIQIICLLQGGYVPPKKSAISRLPKSISAWVHYTGIFFFVTNLFGSELWSFVISNMSVVSKKAGKHWLWHHSSCFFSELILWLCTLSSLSALRRWWRPLQMYFPQCCVGQAGMNVSSCSSASCVSSCSSTWPPGWEFGSKLTMNPTIVSISSLCQNP